MGMGEKTRKTKTNAKSKEKIPRVLALPSHAYQMEADRFSSVRKHRK